MIINSKIFFWLSLTVIAYAYIGYPLIVYVLSQFYKKPVKIKYIYPTVSVLMVVHNEQDVIQDKVYSLLELNYPEKRIEILIGSDGSTDMTDEAIEGLIARNIRQDGCKITLIRNETREGAPYMLNLLAKSAKGELLAITNTHQVLDKNALEEIVRNFCDDKVGAVSTNLVYQPAAGQGKAGFASRVYWEYEKFIRKSESRMGSMVGATGALYVIRKDLFPSLPSGLILDEVYIPLKIAEKGYRAIFDKKAKVYEAVSKDSKQEFARKTRNLAGNFQLFLYLAGLFNPFRGKISWQFFSHKFLRLVVPFLMVGVLISSYLMRELIFYRSVFIAQIIFYGLAALGSIFKRKSIVFGFPYMFCMMNAAVVAGLLSLRQKRIGGE